MLVVLVLVVCGVAVGAYNSLVGLGQGVDADPAIKTLLPIGVPEHFHRVGISGSQIRQRVQHIIQLQGTLLGALAVSQADARDRDVIVILSGRHGEFAACHDREGGREKNVIAKENDFRPVACRHMYDRNGSRGHAVQPERVIEQLALNRLLGFVHAAQGAESSVACFERWGF